ncbi:DUF4350 domain-containing protein [Siminovitchia sp. FSL H7-0308]|uniref:DUF4350 domain-containing protein n=1 Tax=unclassified Siminovitchia TaxID=2837530 RepID=UPI0030D5BC03
MEKRSSNNKLWFWGVIALLLLLVSTYLLDMKEPKKYRDYDSESPSPTGLKAWYTYLKDEKNVVQRWRHSPEHLNVDSPNQTLIMVQPAFIPDGAEMDAYKQFMEAGNSIILWSMNPQGMFGLSTEPIDGDGNGKVSDQNKKEHGAMISYRQRLIAAPDDQVLLNDEFGPIALKRQVGDGQLIVSLFPNWLENGQLMEEDHVSLVISLLNEAGGDKVLFDEYIHREKGSGEALILYPQWFLLMMFQLGIMAILWLWYRGKRFGPVLIPREESVRFSDESIRAIAAWYIRGQRYRDSLAIQADFLKQIFKERRGVPFQNGWTDLTPYFLQRGWKKEEATVFLEGLADVLQKESVSKQEYLLWSKKIDRVRKEVERG